MSMTVQIPVIIVVNPQTITVRYCLPVKNHKYVEMGLPMVIVENGKGREQYE